MQNLTESQKKSVNYIQVDMFIKEDKSYDISKIAKNCFL